MSNIPYFENKNGDRLAVVNSVIYKKHVIIIHRISEEYPEYFEFDDKDKLKEFAEHLRLYVEGIQ